MHTYIQICIHTHKYVHDLCIYIRAHSLTHKHVKYTEIEMSCKLLQNAACRLTSNIYKIKIEEYNKWLLLYDWTKGLIIIKI